VSWKQWRTDFPALVREPELAYLDSACLTPVPHPVLRAMQQYYEEFPACAGRSVHRWSEEVTSRVQRARETWARYFGAVGTNQLVCVRNATEAINIVARGLAFRRGDRVLISDQEHNSNLVVWQDLVRRRGLRLEVLPLPPDRPFDGEALEEALRRGIRLVSFFHASNVDGRRLPVREIVERSHDAGAQVLLDGCQAAPHERVDLARLGVDYYALSFHKMLGPTGTGLLYGAPGRLEGLRPLVLGGETVAWSEYDRHELLPPPQRFEAGLQNYAGILGAGAAVDYLARVDLAEVRAQERSYQETLYRELQGIPGFSLIGLRRSQDRGGIFSFNLEGVDPHDAALFLDQGYRVLVRSGMNCVHSWYRARGLEGNVRASFYLYTSPADVTRLIEGLRELRERMPWTPSHWSPKGVLPGIDRSTGHRALVPPPRRGKLRGPRGSLRCGGGGPRGSKVSPVHRH